MNRFIVVFLVFMRLLVFLPAEAQLVEVDSLLNLLQQKLTDTAKIDVLNGLAFIHIHKNPLIAADDVNIALQNAEDINYVRGQAKSYNVLGGINWAQGNYPVALDFYLRAAETYHSIGDEINVAKCHNNIGEIYKKINELDKAREYLTKAMKSLEEIFGMDKALMVYINMAEIYLKQDSLNKAEMYYERVIHNYEMNNNKKMAYAYTGLGQIALRRNEFKRAEHYFSDALELRQMQGDKRGISDIYLRLGELLHAQQLYDSAASYYDVALFQASEIKARDLVMESLMGRVMVDSSRLNYKAALDDYLLYTAVKDSLFNREKSDQIARLQTAYETQLLKKENEANQVKVKQQNVVMVNIIMALVLALALAGAFYKQRKSEQKANKLLLTKNKEIQDRNEEIQRQSEELSDLNNKLTRLNEGLESQVKIRTKLLREQNEILSQYAFVNAHELRAPVANILGLVYLLEKTELVEREREIVDHLSRSTHQLDYVIQEIRKNLENSEEIVFNSSPELLNQNDFSSSR